MFIIVLSEMNKKVSRCQSTATARLPFGYVHSNICAVSHGVPQGPASNTPQYVLTDCSNSVLSYSTKIRRLIQSQTSCSSLLHGDQSGRQRSNRPPAVEVEVLCYSCDSSPVANASRLFTVWQPTRSPTEKPPSSNPTPLRRRIYPGNINIMAEGEPSRVRRVPGDDSPYSVGGES